jgi:twitching motility protein PilT
LVLPPVFHDIAKLRQGFVLVTGPTGHGKTTSLAAVIDEINRTRDAHILTLEDPVEYIFSKSKAFVSQREFGNDFYSWDDGLKAALREDPDVVLVGEMRDFETIASALTIAETGHLVLATLHTNSSAQTIDRIVDVFPENQQPQIKLQLSNVLEVVISQRLLPKVGSGRVAVDEIMIATSAVKSTIREGKTHLIDNIIQTSADVGMKTLEMALAEKVIHGEISLEIAQEYSTRPEEVVKLMHGAMK